MYKLQNRQFIFFLIHTHQKEQWCISSIHHFHTSMLYEIALFFQSCQASSHDLRFQQKAFFWRHRRVRVPGHTGLTLFIDHQHKFDRHLSNISNILNQFQSLSTLYNQVSLHTSVVSYRNSSISCVYANTLNNNSIVSNRIRILHR